MLTVRCTAKLLGRLTALPEATPAPSTTRLGDWYATILPIRPAHLILLVNESTRLAAVLPAREISSLPGRIPKAILEVMLELGASADVMDAEREAMTELRVARTASRSVLGTMNDYITQIGAGPEGSSPREFLDLAMILNRTPVSPLKYSRPDDVARLVLRVDDDFRRAKATGRPSPSPATTSSVFALRVSLRDVEPEVWRSVLVRSDLTLFKLHGVLQKVMGWSDSHLHQFRDDQKVYGRPDPEFPGCLDERKAVLSDVLRSVADRVVYEYDFGDGWEHDVVLEQVLESSPTVKYPHVTGGARGCPPEDCGGPPGYEHLLDVLARPRHPEHRELVDWVGGSFDPEAFDRGAVNRALQGGPRHPASAAATRSR